MSQKAGARLAPYASFHKHGASGTIKQCNIFLAVVFVVVRLVGNEKKFGGVYTTMIEGHKNLLMHTKSVRVCINLHEVRGI